MLRTIALASAVLLAPVAWAQSDTPTSSFVEGLQLDAAIARWHTDADAKHYRQVVEAVDERVDKDGHLTLKADENEIDFARAILLVCRVSKYKPRYFAAAKQIHDDLVARMQPLTPAEMFATIPFRVQYDVTFADSGDIAAAVAPLSSPPRNAAKVRGDFPVENEPVWVTAALVDTLAVLPETNPHRAALLAALRSAEFHGSAAHLLVSSAMAQYALDKSIRFGLLPPSTPPDRSGFGSEDWTPLDRAATDLSQSETSQLATSTAFSGIDVTIDGWFNSQTRTTPAGNSELFHYKWDDEADSGYSFFGRALQRFGAHLSTLAEEPTAQNLAKTQVYVIVSPDIPAKNPHPHYVEPRDVEAITRWVARGGVLLLFHNDKTNTEFEHFNTLTERFGIHFNPVLKNPVEGTKWVQAQVPIPAKTTGVFQDAHLAYMKEIDTISTQPPAQPVLRDTLHGSGDVYMAVSHYGRGVVFATVDPWLYNEYTDGQKLGSYDVVHFDPYPAAIDLAHWALQQTRGR